MPSPTTIRIICEPYLIKFLEKLYGPAPIQFPKGSNFNTILEVFLDKPPQNYDPTETFFSGPGVLEIRLPYLEHKNVLSYWYLTETKQRVLIKEIWKFFKITFRSEISKHIVLGLDRQDAIQLFIEKYDLDQDVCDMLQKDFQRYVKLRSYHKLGKAKKNSSDKDPVCPAVS